MKRRRYRPRFNNGSIVNFISGSGGGSAGGASGSASGTVVPLIVLPVVVGVGSGKFVGSSKQVRAMLSLSRSGDDGGSSDAAAT